MNRITLHRFGALGVLGLVAAAPTDAPPPFPSASPASQGMSAEALDELADTVRGYVKDEVIVGGELMVIKNRHVVLHEVFGDLDRDEEIAWEKNTICNIRSMAMCLTGAAAQILVDEGKLGIDDAVAKYLPSFNNDASRGITIRHLLTHRSGLPYRMQTRRFYLDRQHRSPRPGKFLRSRMPSFFICARVWSFMMENLLMRWPLNTTSSESLTLQRAPRHGLR